MSGFILLVEDNPDDVYLTRVALHEAGLTAELRVIADGKEALDFIFARGAHAQRDPAQLPALVLLDLDLPRVSGAEVLQELRENESTRDVPVVILTGSKQEHDELCGQRDGANQFIRKPASLGEYSSTARELARYWTQLHSDATPPAICAS